MKCRNDKKDVLLIYEHHKGFLYWYFRKNGQLSELFAFRAMKRLINIMYENINELKGMNEDEQRRYLICHAALLVSCKDFN